MKITEEDIVKALSDMNFGSNPADRQFRIQTGTKGEAMIKRTMRTISLKESLKYGIQDKKIDIIEGDRLLQMLNSPDDESFEMAAMIITNRTYPVKFK